MRARIAHFQEHILKHIQDDIKIVQCGYDNYSYIIDTSQGFIIIDPTEADEILKHLPSRDAHISALFLTHHHNDHTAGVPYLKKTYNAQVFGPDKRIRLLDCHVQDSQTYRYGSYTLKVFATPAHTKTSVCYYLTHDRVKPGALFTGDTLFVGGCGRLFEGTAEDMYTSFQRIASLPDETLIYCGHDYAIENYEFYLSIFEDAGVEKALHDLRSGNPSIPSTLLHEKKFNIFFHTHDANIRNALGLSQACDRDVFRKLRMLKDSF